MVLHPLWLRRWLILALFLSGFVAQAAPGDLDTSYATGTGPNGEIRQLVAIPDGKALISGWFESYDGVSRHFFARVLPNGGIDESFNAGAGPDQGTVQAMLPLLNGKFLVGGLFRTFAGVNRPLLVQMESSGAVDQSFDLHLDPPSEFSGGVGLLRARPNGQFLVSGQFKFRGESEIRNLARFNADGTPDRIFQPNLNIYWLDDFAVQADGCVIISGGFQNKEGADLNRLLRLNPDGSIDGTFQAPALTDSPNCVAIQPDGKIIAAGGGVSMRLLATGATDSTFTPANISRGEVRSLVLQHDGKILLGGQLNDGVNPASRGVARLNADGSLDATFSTGPAGIPGVQRAALDITGHVLVAGLFTTVQGTARTNIARLQGGEALVDGAGEFKLASPSYVVNEGSWNLQVAVVRTGGNSLPATINISSVFGTADGSDYMPGSGALPFASGETLRVINIPIINEFLIEPDETFTVVLSAPTGGATLGSPSSSVVTIVDDDRAGRIEWIPVTNNVSEAAGSATLTVTRNGVTLGAITVNYATTQGTATDGVDFTGASGTVSFADGENLKTIQVPIANDSAKEGPENLTVKLSEPTGGAVLATGVTATVNIVDDDMPGAIAPGFNVTPPPANAARNVRAMVELADGRILVADSLGQYAIRRLNADGSTDASFAPVFPDGATINQLAVQSDGRIIVFGRYLRATNDWRREIIRLNADGSDDLTFNPGSGNGMLVHMTLQPDDRVIVIGTFTSIGGGSRNYMARLDINGSLDESFNAGPFAPDEADAILVQPDGKILVGGWGFKILRFYPGGEIDADFNVDSQLLMGSSRTRALALQPDGKILAGGRFLFAGGAARTLVRLMPDGSLDPAFSISPLPSQMYIEATFVLVQPDGKIIANGFPAYTVSGDSYSNVERRNPDGSPDPSFQVTGFSGGIAVLMQSGSLLLPSIRLEGGSDLIKIIGGDLDAPTGGQLGFGWAGYEVYESAGKVAVHVIRKNGNTGTVTVNYATVEGTALPDRDYLSRSGTLTFAPGEIAKSIEVPVLDTPAVDGTRQFAIALSEPSGATLGTATSTTVSIRDAERPGRLQLNAATFSIREGASFTMSVKRTFGTDGRITVDYSTVNQTATSGTDFTAASGSLVFEANEIEKTFTVQALTDGASEGPETFQVQLANPTGGASVAAVSTATVTIRDLDDAGSFASYDLLGVQPQVLAMAKQPDGKVIVAGSFPAIPGEVLVRLNPDGSLDNTFNGDPVTGNIGRVAVAPDGKILVAGSSLGPVAGVPASQSNVLRLNADGTIDPTFTSAVTTDQMIWAIGAQTDGKIILSGTFTTLNGAPRPYLARLLSDGQPDTSFQPTATYPVTVMVVDRDDSILFATRPNKLVRLKPDGAVDPNFTTQIVSQFNNATLSPSSIVIDRLGRILIGGYFNTVNGFARKNVARLLSNGRVDPDFFAGGASSDGAPDVITLQDDGRIFIGSYHYYASGGIRRLLEGGTIDPGFNVEPVASTLWAHLSGMAVLNDRGLLVSGAFKEIDGVSQENLALLLLGSQPGSFKFTVGRTLTVTENGGPVTLTVNRFGGSEGRATIKYETFSNPPLATDYESTSGTLVFEDGETSKSFVINLINDSQHEAPERFFVGLSEPETAFLWQANAWLDITIQDDDPRQPGAMQFTASSVEVNEDDEFVTLTIERVGGADGAVSVVATTVPGTAAEGADYVARYGTFDFANGVTSRTISIPLLGGDLAEPPESFTVVLSDPLLGATLGNPSTVTVTINDADTGTLDEYRGTYAGLVNNDASSTRGFIKLTIGARGSVSGVLIFDGQRHAFRGRLDLDGRLTISVPRKDADSLELSLALDILSPETEQITGSVAVGDGQFEVTADRQTFHASTDPTGAAGRYALTFSPNAQADLPAGHGYASLNISKGGTVRVAGRLADGTPFSQAAFLAKSGGWSLFAPLYRNTGVLTGWMQMHDNETWTCSGMAYWMKPAREKDVYYPGGFADEIYVTGNAAPSSGFTIDNSSAVSVTLSGGGLVAPAGPLPLSQSKPGSFRGSEGLKLSLNAATGLLTGEFIHPQTQRRLRLRGAYLPAENRATGYFLGADTSGSMELTITPAQAP